MSPRVYSARDTSNGYDDHYNEEWSTDRPRRRRALVLRGIMASEVRVKVRVRVEGSIFIGDFCLIGIQNYPRLNLQKGDPRVGF